MPKLMDLELNQRATSNTVKRLLLRVRNLEIEMARLKSLLKRSVLMSIDKRSPPPPAVQSEINTTADIIEIPSPPKAVEKEIISVPSDTSEGESGREDTQTVENSNQLSTPGLGVMREIGTENNVGISNIITDGFTVEGNGGTENQTDDAQIAKITIKSPSKLFDTKVSVKKKKGVWSHFQKTDMLTKDKKWPCMMCKHCKKAIRGKVDSLKNHLDICPIFSKSKHQRQIGSKTGALMTKEQLSSYRKSDSPGTSSYFATKVVPVSVHPKSVDKMPIPPNGMVYVAGGSAIAVSTVSPERKPGRKKSPIWKGFTTLQREQHGRVVANCNKCNEDVTPHATKLKYHLKFKCSANVKSSRPKSTAQ